MRFARSLVALGSLILFATALLHGSGYATLSGKMENSNAAPFLVSAFKAVWLMISAHLIVLSAVLVTASHTPIGKPVVLLGALIPALDTMLLLHFLGAFIGVYSLAVATLCLLVGGFGLPQGEKA